MGKVGEWSSRRNSEQEAQVCTRGRRARRDTRGIVTVLGGVNQESEKERIPGTGGGRMPSVNRLEVGPRHDLIATGTWCVELDGNTQAIDSHRPFGAETLDGF